VETMTDLFEISPTDKIVCAAQKTRNGFRHLVRYMRNGNEIASKSVSYLNRTWEKWDYETAIGGLLDKMDMSDADKQRIHDICEKQALGQTDSMLKTVAATAALGEIFGTSLKEKNDWKARMLKAGLGNQGLSIPEDWDTLSETEKEKRLNAVIKMMKK
jgi:hypothetical protein